MIYQGIIYYTIAWPGYAHDPPEIGTLLPPTVLESILHVVQAEFVVVRKYPDDVESQSIEIRVPLGQVLLGDGAEGGLFVRGNGFQRVAETCTAPQFDFNEDEGVFLAHDQVDLPVASPVVAFDERVAAPGEVTERKVLTPRS
jgi:hypothetical protein